MLSCKYLVREKSGEVSKYFLTLFYGIVVVEITTSLAGAVKSYAQIGLQALAE